MNTRIEFNVTAGCMITLAKVILAINIFLLAGTFVFNTAHAQLPPLLFVIVRETDLASENVFAAWYSSMLLLLSAVMSIACFLIDQQAIKDTRKRLLNYGWLIYAFAFVLLSFDELGSIHEHIGNFTAFKKAGNIISDDKDSGWTLFYMVIGAASLFMLAYSIVKLNRVKWALPLWICGLMLYLSNPFQEYLEIETMRSSATDETWKRPVHLLLMEEGSELFGSLFFLIAIMLYARDHVFRKEINKIELIRLTLFFVLGVAISFILVNLMFGDVKGDLQNGVPKNWITAAYAFLISICCIFVYYNDRIKSYLLLGVLGLCLSVYFGSNRFAWHFDADYSVDRIIVKTFLSVFALISCWVLIKNFQSNSFIKLLTGMSFLIVVAGIYVKRLYSAEILFTGLTCLIFLLLAERLNLKSGNRQNKW